jgi:putative phosphoesterase
MVIANRIGLKFCPYGRAPRDAGAVLRIGVISDTHGLLRPEVEQRLAGVAHIVHAGDIGSPNVIAELQRIAPIIAIRGNVDTGHWAEHYPETQMVTLGGCCIYVLHDVQTLQLDPVSSGVDVVVCGHSHRPRIESIRGVLYLNPGSAGPRRFNLPVTVATLDLTAGGPNPLIHDLGSAG